MLRFSVKERKEIDPLLRARKRLLKRAERVDSLLSRIQKDGATIRKHCDASQEETQAAIHGNSTWNVEEPKFTSDDVMDTAYDWLCRRRRGAVAKAAASTGRMVNVG